MTSACFQLLGGAGVAVAMLATGCSNSDTAPAGLGGWTPGTMLPSSGETSRGLRDVRGLIHAHSVYSHDACDGMPRDEATDAVNAPCRDDFRRGLCRAMHDFVMLTDHSDSFVRSEYPDVLLHDPAQGDTLVTRATASAPDGTPVAGWLGCGGDRAALVMAGTESAMMPVGIEGHVAADQAGRDAVYGEVSQEAVEALRAQGAVTLLQHTEDWPAQQIIDLGVDGFEMYNLHANTLSGAGGVVSLFSRLSTPALLPQSDLVLLPIVNEDARYLDTWSTVLASGAKRVTTMGTDCHRNSFPQLLPDGERIDSYRRMMAWMSNHLLIEAEADGSWDDRHVKDALRGGRLYGAFEVFGYPQGFAFFALQAGQAREMGSEVSLAAGVTLEVTRPLVRALDPKANQPVIEVQILKADPGGWQLVAQAGDDLSYEVTEPGAYRAEIRITPHHLAPYLASYAELAGQSFVWIYANPIYVTP